MFGENYIDDKDLMIMACMNVAVLVSKSIGGSYSDNIKAFLFERKILSDDQLDVLYETIKEQHDFEINNDKEYIVKTKVEKILKRLKEAKGSKKEDEDRSLKCLIHHLDDILVVSKESGLDKEYVIGIEKCISEIKSYGPIQEKINEDKNND